MTGRIMTLAASGQYGFIEPDDGSAQVFVSADDVAESWRDVAPGTAVRFSTLQGARGPRAYNVIVLQCSRQALVRRHEGSSTNGRPNGNSRRRGIGLLSRRRYQDEILAVLTSAVPSITGAQIAEVRAILTEYAASRGWLELDELIGEDLLSGVLPPTTMP
jgi:CspA family cold shock protein